MREGFIPFGFIRRIKKASRRGARNPGELGWFLSPWIVLLLMASLAARLSVSMAGPSHSGPVPPLSEVEQASGERLCQDVDALAGAIGERNLRRAAALEAAARVVRDLAKRDAWPAQTAGFFIGAQR